MLQSLKHTCNIRIIDCPKSVLLDSKLLDQGRVWKKFECCQCRSELIRNLLSPKHALIAQNILQTEFPSQGFNKSCLCFHGNRRTDIPKNFV